MNQSPVVVQDGVPRVVNEQTGLARFFVFQPVVERYVKQALAAIVIGCGATAPFLSPTEDAFALKACSIVVAVGAALGITSRGNPPPAR